MASHSVSPFNSSMFHIEYDCEYKLVSVTSKGLFQGDDPMKHSLTVILMQLGTAILLTSLLRRILQPLHQPRFIAEMLVSILNIIIVLMIMLNASIVTPILTYLYDPSKRYINYKRRTIQHSRHESELKTLVCIHEEDDFFGLMNVLKAAFPTRKTPIVMYALDLMELVGQMTPIFINHQFHKHRSPTAKTNRTDRVISAFQQFESQFEGIRRYNFTAITPLNSMHDEICTLALDKNVSLLIIPFHRSETISMRSVKRNVLDKSPCSVGILVNKRIVLSCNRDSLAFHVCVAFLGGPDAREALAFAMRMLENPATKVTVIRLIAEDEFVSDLLETKLDVRAIMELKSRSSVWASGLDLRGRAWDHRRYFGFAGCEKHCTYYLNMFQTPICRDMFLYPYWVHPTTIWQLEHVESEFQISEASLK